MSQNGTIIKGITLIHINSTICDTIFYDLCPMFDFIKESENISCAKEEKKIQISWTMTLEIGGAASL